MNIKNLALTFVLSLLSLTSAHAAAPANDSAAKAIELKSTFMSLPAQNLNLATAATTDPFINGVSAGKTLWYVLPRTVNSPGLAWTVDVVSTDAVGSVTSFFQIDRENPFTSLAGATTKTFTAGQTVTLQHAVGTANPMMVMVAGTGTFELRHHASADFVGDFPSNAYPYTNPVRGTWEVDNRLATVTADEPAVPLSVGVVNTVWMKWIPNFTDTAAVDTNFSFTKGYSPYGFSLATPIHNTVIAVYRETANGLIDVVADDDGGWQTNSRAVFAATAGTSYYIMVGTKTGWTPGKITLNYYRANTGGEVSLIAEPTYGDLGTRSEAGGPHPISVMRRYAGNFSGSAKITSDAANSSAQVTDYQALNQTLTFPNPAGDTEDAWLNTANLILNDDSVVDAQKFETVAVVLSTPFGVTLSSPINGHVNVFDDEWKPAPAFDGFEVDNPVIRVSEHAGNVGTKLRRTNEGANYFYIIPTVTGTAVVDTDLIAYGNQITVQATSTDLSFKVIDDDVFEGEKTATVTYNLPTPIVVTVIIEDDDPFLPLVGRLTTVLHYGNGARVAQCYATVSATGVVTGKLNIVGKSLPFALTLDQRGKGSVLIDPKTRAALRLSIEATDATGGYRFSLLDSANGFLDTTTLVLQNYIAKVNPCPEAGRYSVAGFDGVMASVLVSTTGTATVVGRLYEAPFTVAGYVDGEGKLSAAASMYRGLGCIGISGDLPLANAQIRPLDIFYQRPGRTGDPLKFGAFMQTTTDDVVRYTPVKTAGTALDCWSGGTGKITLAGGALMNATLEKTLTVTPTSITVPGDPDKMKITIVPGTGAFSGSFVLPGSSPAKTLTFYGVLYQFPGTTGFGRGYFFDGLKTGNLTLTKP